MPSHESVFFKPEKRIAAIAGVAFILDLVLGGCGTTQQEKDELRANLTDRGLTVLSVNTDMGNVTADVSFGDKGCLGEYMADVSWAGHHDNSLEVELGIPGSATATQKVTVDNPTLASLKQDPTIWRLCFSDFAGQ